MTMTDADVQKQIKHMMAFIEQEANEKAEEIDAKAEEEFNIEKGRLVQQQRLKIKEFYERKEKQVELQKKIQSSNMLNQARLKCLKARDDHVSSVLEDAKGKLATITKDQQKYTAILQSLLTQGLCQLLEPQVFVRCRQIDQQLVESIIPGAQQDYKAKVGKECAVKLDTENWLSKDCTGGIEILAMKGKIKVDNSLEARLTMVSEQILPSIRGALFGANPNRKFND
eukprot:TRINITY_DN15874_c0_g1_i1.p1 TRINITY_DN15874_c0_g1~~TRINITY_DN15874_c0_g1_i1.p1  ORF type:complete len:227 (-),score=93.72 TRINITY_DN15874_c0_g1_i1:304-984(-)